MTDSDFWRKLAKKFLAIPDSDRLLRAYWKREQAQAFEWSIRTPNPIYGDDAYRREFEALAARGGARIVNPNNRDLLSAFLDALNAEIASDEAGSGGGLIEEKWTRTWGNIHRICEKAATFCKILERRALEAKHLARAERDQKYDRETTEERTDQPCKRGAEVDEFLKRCNELCKARILRRHIWLSVGHSKGRQFEYWQSCDEKKATASDRANFGRILRDGPERFISLLRKKQIIPPAKS